MMLSSQHEISGRDKIELETALSQWQQWANEAPVFKQVLGDGLTNKSYLVESAGRLFVLRINTAKSDALGLDRILEAKILRSASAAGVAPTLIYDDPDRSFQVSKYLEGSQWISRQTKEKSGLDRLAKLIKKIHSQNPVVESLNLEQKADHYWQGIDGENELAQQLKVLKADISSHLEEMKKSESQPCLCHNDLIPENIIVANNGELFAIDWEYASMGDPYFDLAVVAESHGLNNEGRKQLLAVYEGKEISSFEIDRLYHSRIVYSYLTLLWFCVRMPKSYKLQNNDSVQKRLIDFKRLLLSDN